MVVILRVVVWDIVLWRLSFRLLLLQMIPI
jgi:hypothetical protein